MASGGTASRRRPQGGPGGGRQKGVLSGQHIWSRKSEEGGERGEIVGQIRQGLGSSINKL